MRTSRWESAQGLWERLYEQERASGTAVVKHELSDPIIGFCARHLRGCRVLDLGCGSGWFLHDALQLYSIPFGVGVDPAARCIRDAVARDASASRALHFVVGCGELLPLRDASFDTAICISAFDHAFSPDDVIGEVRRTLAPRGVFVLFQHFSYAAMPVYRDILRIVLRIPVLGRRVRRSLKTQETDVHLSFFSYSSLKSLLAGHGLHVLAYQTTGLKLPGPFATICRRVRWLARLSRYLADRVPVFASAIILSSVGADE